jgi:hypothetical protein
MPYLALTHVNEQFGSSICSFGSSRSRLEKSDPVSAWRRRRGHSSLFVGAGAGDAG